MKKIIRFLTLAVLLAAPWGGYFNQVQAQSTLTVYDGTTTNSYVPAYMGYWDDFSRSQFVIPAADLAAMDGLLITSLTFYTNSSNVPYTSASTCDVYLKEVDYTTISAFEPTASATTVYSGTVSVVSAGSGGEMTITFNSPYVYGGGNLLVGIENTTDAGYKFINFYGQTVSGASGAGYNSSSLSGVSFTQRNFIPKTTFSYETPASCAKPTALAAGSVTATGASLTWTAGGTETDWVVEYGTASDFAGATSRNVSTTPTLNLTGLTAQTTYYVRVKAVCGVGDESNWSTTSFTTLEACPADHVCIGSGTSTNSSLPANNYYNYSLTQQIYTAAELGNTPGYILSMDFFKAASTAMEKNLNIYIVSTTKSEFTSNTDWIPVTAADLVYSGTVNFANNDWTTITFDSPFNYDGTSNLAIVVDNNTGAYVSNTNLYVFSTGTTNQALYYNSDSDNLDPTTSLTASGTRVTSKNRVRLHIGEPPSCLKPTALAITNITDVAATITWTAGGSETSWKVYNGSTLVATVNTNSYTFTSLTASTDYTFGVAAVCGVDDESTIATVAGHTACGAVASFPYTMGFETADAEKLACWTTVDADGDGNGWDFSALTAHTGTYVATSASYDNNSGELFPDNWLISPAITLPNDRDMQLSWWEVGQDASWPDETYSVYISTTGNTTADFNTTELQPMFTATAAYVNHIINLAAYRGETIWIAYRHYDCSDLYQLNIDDISVEDAPSCAAPADIAVDSWTYNTVTVSWTDNNAGGSTYVILDDLDNEVVTITGLSSTGVTITGLTAETNYPLGSFKVKAVCSGSEESSPVNVPAFYTGYCQSAPGTGYPINSVVFGNGANTVNNTTTPAGAPYYGDYHNMVGTVYQGMTADIDITFGASALRTLIWVDWDNSLSFEPSELVYNAVSPAGNPSTVNASFPIDNAQTLGDYRMRIGASSSYFNSYQVPCYYGTNFDVVYHDYTLRVAAVPSCMPPADLAITPASVDAHGATLTWTSTASAWEVSYSEHAADSWSTPVAANTASYTFTGLTSETSYDVRVRANCGVDGYSDWVTLANAFTTDIACFAPTALAASNITNHTADVTWTGTSASYNIDYRTAAYTNPISLNEDFTGLASGIPAGWDNSEGTTTYESYKWSYNNNGHDAAPCLRFNSYSNSSNYTNYLKTPTMNFDGGNTMVLSFWWKNPTGGDFSVYISTDGGTTKTELASGLTGQSTWKQEVINLAGYEGASNVTIHFKGTSNYGNGDAYIYLDEVKVGIEVPSGEWQHATSTTETKQLTGLLASTPYEVKVQGDCSASGDGLSTWSTTFFTTDIPCATPTALAAPVSGVKARQVDLTWTSYAEDWQLDVYDQTRGEGFGFFDVNIGDVVQEGNNMTYTLDNLEPETEYIVRLRSNCEASYAGDGQSEWTAPLNVTTLEDCSTPTNVTVTNVTDQGATVAWNGDDAEFNVKYRTASEIDPNNIALEEPFATNSIPTGWTRYSGLLNNVMGGTALATTTSGWTTNTYALGTYNLKVNIFGSSCNYWAVTPAIDVPTDAVLSFDLALTDYGNSDPIEDNTAQADDRFVVLITNDDMATWTILREWNNSGSTYVYNNIATAGEPVTIDLSAYDGQNVKIAFYGESTVSGGDNDLHIDNVSVAATVATEPWNVDNTSSLTHVLDGLDPDTKYEVVVAPGCDDNLTSTRVYFTTLAAITKNIVADQWYAISSPVHNSGNNETFAGVTNLTSGTYDLLYWDQANGAWKTSKPAVITSFTRGQGYIYRRSDAATLTFVGQRNSGNFNSDYLYYSCPDLNLKGFHLVGNPYPVAYTPIVDYYKLSTNGTWTANTASTGSVAVAEGFFIKKASSGYYAFAEPSGAKSAPRSNAATIALTVSNDDYSDIAYARFADGEGMPKMAHLNTEAPALSIPQGDRRYAIANLDENTESFPLHFSGFGEYTFSLSDNSLGLGYLHLVDRETGADVDMLRQSGYTFNANGNESERFVVLLRPTADANSFVRVSGTRLIVDGEGELQVFDVMGRQLGSAQVAGTATLDRSALGIVSAGVYVMRLGGNSQKIVVK